MSAIDTNDYGRFLHDIKQSIRSHQLQSMRAVNKELLALYWEIGKTIHEKQTELGWGKAVVETLAKDLQMEFPGRNGFSAQNLWFMRQLYVEYQENEKLQPLVRDISWSKNLLIMARCKDDLERALIRNLRTFLCASVVSRLCVKFRKGLNAETPRRRDAEKHTPLRAPAPPRLCVKIKTLAGVKELNAETQRRRDAEKCTPLRAPAPPRLCVKIKTLAGVGGVV